MQDTQEIWKDVVGYEGLYKVSNYGRVITVSRTVKGSSRSGDRRLKEKILKPQLHTAGYYQINLRISGSIVSRRIHRLVAEAFLGKSDLMVDHINAVRTDNRLTNLRYCSGRENTTHGFLRLKKSSKYTGVCWHKRDKKWAAGIYINGRIKHLGYFDDQEDARAAYQKELSKIK